MRRPNPWLRVQNQTWYVQIGGRQVNLGKDKDSAETQYDTLWAKYRQGTLTHHSVREVLDAYWKWLKVNRAASTVKRREPILKEFGKSVSGTLKVRELKGYHVEKFVQKHHAKNSATTRHTVITIIQAAFGWAAKAGYVESNPLSRMEKPTPTIRQEFLPADTWENVLKLTSGPLLDFLTFMLATGVRPQEMYKFEAEHYQGGKLVLPIIDSKGNRRSRVIYLPDEAKEIVERLVKQYTDGKLFRNTRGVPWNKSSINCAFRKLKVKLDQPKLCATTLRHSFSHYRLTSGQDALVVSKLLGHTSTVMLSKRYGHLEANAEFMQEAANRKAIPRKAAADESVDVQDSSANPAA